MICLRVGVPRALSLGSLATKPGNLCIQFLFCYALSRLQWMGQWRAMLSLIGALRSGMYSFGITCSRHCVVRPRLVVCVCVCVCMCVRAEPPPRWWARNGGQFDHIIDPPPPPPSAPCRLPRCHRYGNGIRVIIAELCGQFSWADGSWLLCQLLDHLCRVLPDLHNPVVAAFHTLLTQLRDAHVQQTATLSATVLTCLYQQVSVGRRKLTLATKGCPSIGLTIGPRTSHRSLNSQYSRCTEPPRSNQHT